MAGTDNFETGPAGAMLAEMLAWALVEAADPEAIDVFLSRERAEQALAECLLDEPEWRFVLGIEEIELVASFSPN